MARFKGLSTINKTSGPYTLTDAELVKRDILNELTTRRGSRIGNVSYGSNLHLYLGEPNEQAVVDAIEDEVRLILRRDPRVTVVSVSIQVGDHSILISATINYDPLGTTDQLYLEYTENTGI